MGHAISLPELLAQGDDRRVARHQLLKPFGYAHQRPIDCGSMAEIPTERCQFGRPPVEVLHGRRAQIGGDPLRQFQRLVVPMLGKLTFDEPRYVLLHLSCQFSRKGVIGLHHQQLFDARQQVEHPLFPDGRAQFHGQCHHLLLPLAYLRNEFFQGVVLDRRGHACQDLRRRPRSRRRRTPAWRAGNPGRPPPAADRAEPPPATAVLSPAR